MFDSCVLTRNYSVFVALVEIFDCCAFLLKLDSDMADRAQ